MSDWLTWQIVDSAFPTGLFAHSWGIESMWQHGEIENADDLRAIAHAAIVQAGHAAVPFVTAAFKTPEALERLDGVADAFLTSAVTNRASRTQGRTLIATAVRVWPADSLTALRTKADATCSHVAPLWGATFRLVGLPLATVQRILLYGTIRGVLSAAVRLGIVGSYEAQRLQLEAAPALERVAEECAHLSIGDLAQTAPTIEIFQSRHDALYSRLFQT